MLANDKLLLMADDTTVNGDNTIPAAAEHRRVTHSFVYVSPNTPPLSQLAAAFGNVDAMTTTPAMDIPTTEAGVTEASAANEHRTDTMSASVASNVDAMTTAATAEISTPMLVTMPATMSDGMKSHTSAMVDVDNASAVATTAAAMMMDEMPMEITDKVSSFEASSGVVQQQLNDTTTADELPMAHNPTETMVTTIVANTMAVSTVSMVEIESADGNGIELNIVSEPEEIAPTSSAMSDLSSASTVSAMVNPERDDEMSIGMTATVTSYTEMPTKMTTIGMAEAMSTVTTQIKSTQTNMEITATSMPTSINYEYTQDTLIADMSDEQLMETTGNSVHTLGTMPTMMQTSEIKTTHNNVDAMMSNMLESSGEHVGMPVTLSSVDLMLETRTPETMEIASKSTLMTTAQNEASTTPPLATTSIMPSTTESMSNQPKTTMTEPMPPHMLATSTAEKPAAMTMSSIMNSGPSVQRPAEIEAEDAVDLVVTVQTTTKMPVVTTGASVKPPRRGKAPGSDATRSGFSVLSLLLGIVVAWVMS